MAEDGTDWEKRYKDLQRYVDGFKEDAENWRTFTSDPKYKPALDLIEPLEKGTYKPPSAEAPRSDDGEPTWFKPYAEQLKAERKKKFDDWLQKQEQWEKDTKAKYPELGDDFFGATGKLAVAMKRIGTDDPEEAFRVVAPPPVLVKYYAPSAEPPKDEKPNPKSDAPLGGKPSGKEDEEPPRSWEEAVARRRAEVASSQ